MAEIRFADGVTIETDGPYRIIREFDGLYVVGHGMLSPVESHEEGERMIVALLSRTL